MDIPTKTPNPLTWLDANWPFAGTVALFFLVALLPIIVSFGAVPTTMVYLLLVIYVVHQCEEHYGDRFRTFVNEKIAGGVEALTSRATMLINIGYVWVVYAATLLLVTFVDPGFGFIAVYTTLLNAGGHIGPAIALRQYNPGLITAIVLFLPVGAAAWYAIDRTSDLGAGGHLLGIAVALFIHGSIIVHVRRRQAMLNGYHGEKPTAA